MEIYARCSNLQLTKAKTLLQTRDYEIILTNGGSLHNDLFSFLHHEPSRSPHYLWEVLKSRYRRMNVRLSVCVMGLIMVSGAPHNEPHPHRRAISPTLAVWRALHSSAVSCFKRLRLQVAVWPTEAKTHEPRLAKTSLGNDCCSCFSHLSAPLFADT